MCILSFTISDTVPVTHTLLSIMPQNNTRHCVSFKTDHQKPLLTTLFGLYKTVANCVCVRDFAVVSINAIDFCSDACVLSWLGHDLP